MAQIYLNFSLLSMGHKLTLQTVHFLIKKKNTEFLQRIKQKEHSYLYTMAQVNWGGKYYEDVWWSKKQN